METLFLAYKMNRCEKQKKNYSEAKRSLRILYDVLINYDVKKYTPWLTAVTRPVVPLILAGRYED